MYNERTDKLHDLDVAISRFEDVLKVQFPLHLGDDRIARALHELYATKSAYDLLSRIAAFCPKEVECARKLSADQPSVQRTLPNPDAISSFAPSLFNAVTSGDRNGMVKVLEKMGVLALCPPPDQMFGRLEFCVGNVLGRSRLIVLIELAIFAAELEMYARTSIYVREAQDLVPGPSELHDLHTIEGVIALGGGNKAGALRHLSESVRVCQEDDFARVTCSIRAPNLELATKLLWHSEQKGVIAYLAGCQLVWLHLAKQIDTWIDTIRNGEKPEFHSSSGILSAMDRPETKLRTLLIKASFSDTLNPGIGLRGTRMGFEKTLTEYKRRMAAAISGKLDTGKN